MRRRNVDFLVYSTNIVAVPRLRCAPPRDIYHPKSHVNYGRPISVASGRVRGDAVVDFPLDSLAVGMPGILVSERYSHPRSKHRKRRRSAVNGRTAFRWILAAYAGRARIPARPRPLRERKRILFELIRSPDII